MTRKICVFGASGATGIILIQQAVEKGFEVVAFVRSQAAQDKLPAGVTGVLGDLLKRSDVEGALAGCEAVVCLIGPRPDSPEVFCAVATQNIIDAMQVQGVHRLLCQTGAMIGDYPHLSWFMRWMKNSYQKQQPALANDRTEQEARVMASGLDWTLVKPPRLANGKARGQYKSGVNLKVGAFSNISRADLSRFILEEMEKRAYVGQRVVVRY